MSDALMAANTIINLLKPGELLMLAEGAKTYFELPCLPLMWVNPLLKVRYAPKRDAM